MKRRGRENKGEHGDEKKKKRAIVGNREGDNKQEG